MSELQPGHIFTLPLKAVYSSTELDQMPFNPDILGHPFVILSLPARGLNAEIALVRTIHTYLPCRSSPFHPFCRLATDVIGLFRSLH